MKDRLRKCTTYEIKWHLSKQAGETSKKLVHNKRRKERIAEAGKEVACSICFLKPHRVYLKWKKTPFFMMRHTGSVISFHLEWPCDKTRTQSPHTGHARPLPVPCCHPDRKLSLWRQEDAHCQPGNMSAPLLGSSTFSPLPLLTLYSVALSFLSTSCSSGSAWLILAGLSLCYSSWWLFFVCLLFPDLVCQTCSQSTLGQLVTFFPKYLYSPANLRIPPRQNCCRAKQMLKTSSICVLQPHLPLLAGEWHADLPGAFAVGRHC